MVRFINKSLSHACFRRAVLSLVLLCSTMVMSAEKDDRQSAIFNKIKFFSWLVNDSPTVGRIKQSSDSEAIAQLAQARQLLEQAQAQYDDGELSLADEKIAAGLKEMTSVSRKIKDQDRVEKARNALFHELKQHVLIFAEAFERVAEEKNDKIVDALLDRKKLNDTVEHADRLYREGQLALANHVLKGAADMVEGALSDARHKDVLLHELSFDSLEDEYLYEKKRNESYVMLIKLLQDRQTVSDASRQFVSKIVSTNKEVMQQAEKHAAKGDKAKAITVLEKGTDKLSRALRMSGASF